MGLAMTNHILVSKSVAYSDILIIRSRNILEYSEFRKE